MIDGGNILRAQPVKKAYGRRARKGNATLHTGRCVEQHGSGKRSLLTAEGRDALLLSVLEKLKIRVAQSMYVFASAVNYRNVQDHQFCIDAHDLAVIVVLLLLLRAGRLSRDYDEQNKKGKKESVGRFIREAKACHALLYC